MYYHLFKLPHLQPFLSLLSSSQFSLFPFFWLFSKLFVNLRNAATSWGTESKQYKEIQKMVQDLLREMQDAGEKTNLSGLKQKQLQEADDLSAAFEKLDLQLKDQEAAERMEE